LALKSCTSLLNSLVSTLITPASCYLDYLIVPESAYHQAGFNRAFIDRLKSVQYEGWPDGFRVQHIRTITTTLSIPPTLMSLKSSNQNQSGLTTALSSVVYVRGRPVEAILGGVKMGNQFPPGIRGASYLSRRRFAQDFIDMVSHRASCLLDWTPSSTCTYEELKEKVGGRVEPVKHSARQALGRWIQNDGDYGFSLVAHCHSPDE
jgi:tRNA-specific adenosine deaminase 1